MNYAPLFERIGRLGTCVLPAEVLDNTPLTDPDIGAPLLSLRQCCSCQRLCYVQVLDSFAEDLYWADVAATPDLIDAERVVLTETHLTYALAWDKRLFWRTPAQIRRLMFAQARELAPLQPCAEPEPTTNLLPAPEVPLIAVATVEVTADDLRAAVKDGLTFFISLKRKSSDLYKKHSLNKSPGMKLPNFPRPEVTHNKQAQAHHLDQANQP